MDAPFENSFHTCWVKIFRIHVYRTSVMMIGIEAHSSPSLMKEVTPPSTPASHETYPEGVFLWGLGFTEVENSRLPGLELSGIGPRCA